MTCLPETDPSANQIRKQSVNIIIELSRGIILNQAAKAVD